MIILPNNCRAGKIAVVPANWKTVRASLKKPWYITYRFYDDNLRTNKKVVLKGMNGYQLLKDRQKATRLLIEDELNLIERQGLNRFTGLFTIEQENDVTGFTPFIEALEFSFEKIEVKPRTRIDIRSVLKYVTLAAVRRGYDRLPVKDITKKHIRLTLDECGKIKPETNIPIGNTGRTKKGVWSANQFNFYHSYLSMLYSQLIELEAVEYNPLEYISKKKSLRKIRKTLSKAERTIINDYLVKHHYFFWRFLQVFFHSGARITEMLHLQRKQVDLEEQKFKLTINKGKSSREEYRTIKTVALELWKEACATAGPDDYIFSIGLKPGSKFIRSEQISHRWNRHIKKRFSIEADFYSLKHTNLDETAALLSLKEAQKMAGHSTPVITMIYAIGEAEREHNKLKDVDNLF